MIFGEFPAAEAEGVVLAHTLKLPQRTLKKGRVLDRADAAALVAAGIACVAGARLGPRDVAEDAAAATVAQLLAGAHLRPRFPNAGRCNLHAETPGVVMVDRERIDRLNRLNEAITLGTLPPWIPVRPGQVVATVKIIPFAVPADLLYAWRWQIGAVPPLDVSPLLPHRGALILSVTSVTSDKALAATAEATRLRLERLGSTLSVVLHCAHGREAVQASLAEALGAGCNLVLIAGATVAKGRADVVPSAITAAGGEILHFGMPVEPGNMLLLARFGAVPVIVMPGCARSRRLNGLDWVLHRLLAGMAVSGRDLMGMGVGGLIRSQAEEQDAVDLAPAPPRPRAGRVAALLLAAGRSTRMGEANKLLLPIAGEPMVRRVAAVALASRCAQVMVVTGHEADRVEAALAGLAVSFTHNGAFADGLAGSLRAGLKALPQDVDGALVLLGDMPRISAAEIDRIVAAFDPEQPAIVVPQQAGRRGNPVLWPRRFFGSMLELQGDAGARGLLERFAAEVETVAFDSDAIFTDVDTPEALEALQIDER